MTRDAVDTADPAAVGPIIVIGLAGLPGAGKDSAASLLQRAGFRSYTLSDVIRDQARARRIVDPDRATLQDLGDDLRRARGAGILGVLLRERMIADHARRAVVNGVRHPEEWRAVVGHPRIESRLLAITATPEIRFRRLRARGRPGDPIDPAGFEQLDERDRGVTSSGTSLQVDAVLHMADTSINNDGMLDDLAFALAAELDRMGLRASARRIRPFQWWRVASWRDVAARLLSRLFGRA